MISRGALDEFVDLAQDVDVGVKQLRYSADTSDPRNPEDSLLVFGDAHGDTYEAVTDVCRRYDLEYELAGDKVLRVYE